MHSLRTPLDKIICHIEYCVIFCEICQVWLPKISKLALTPSRQQLLHIKAQAQVVRCTPANNAELI